jgi:hypothetical protein
MGQFFSSNVTPITQVSLADFTNAWPRADLEITFSEAAARVAKLINVSEVSVLQVLQTAHKSNTKEANDFVSRRDALTALVQLAREKDVSLTTSLAAAASDDSISVLNLTASLSTSNVPSLSDYIAKHAQVLQEILMPLNFDAVLSGALFETLQQCVHLRVLDISNCVVKQGDSFCEFLRRSRVETLRMRRTVLESWNGTTKSYHDGEWGGEWISVFRALSESRSLTSLDVEDVGFRGRSFDEELAHFVDSCATLRVLKVSKNALLGAPLLLHSVGTSKIEQFIARDIGRLPDHGQSSFRTLLSNRFLYVLDFRDNPMVEEFTKVLFEILRDMIPRSSLYSLWVSLPPNEAMQLVRLVAMRNDTIGILSVGKALYFPSAEDFLGDNITLFYIYPPPALNPPQSAGIRPQMQQRLNDNFELAARVRRVVIELITVRTISARKQRHVQHVTKRIGHFDCKIRLEN